MIAEKDFKIHITTKGIYTDVEEEIDFTKAIAEIKSIFYRYNTMPIIGDKLLSNKDECWEIVRRHYGKHLELIIEPTELL